MSVIDIDQSWLKEKIFVSLGIGRTFTVFQIFGTYCVAKETFKICVIRGVRYVPRHTLSKTKKVIYPSQKKSFSHAIMP